MALVTIGVPVYNGEGMIGQCLDCLTRQTYADIEIIVSDNASTDGTAAIVRDHASRDARIRLISQPTNIGLMGNFSAVIEAADTPYFILRCHDDLSSDNYVEALLAAMQGRPGARIAVPAVHTFREGRATKFRIPPKTEGEPSLMTAVQLLLRSHQAWFCGLWDIEAVRPVFRSVWARYDTPWGPDHLLLYPFLISGRIAAAPDAIFIQRITPKTGAADYGKPLPRERLAFRRSFLAMCSASRQEQGIKGWQETALTALTWRHAGRIYRMRDILMDRIAGRH
jgi:glycosyltransferase involved in cell wall biosynthesis